MIYFDFEINEDEQEPILKYPLLKDGAYFFILPNNYTVKVAYNFATEKPQVTIVDESNETRVYNLNLEYGENTNYLYFTEDKKLFYQKGKGFCYAKMV